MERAAARVPFDRLPSLIEECSGGINGVCAMHGALISEVPAPRVAELGEEREALGEGRVAKLVGTADKQVGWYDGFDLPP